MIEPETIAREPSEREATKAKQWMIREKDVKNIVARTMADAQERVTQAGVVVWRDGGALEPFQSSGEVFDTERIEWRERRSEDYAEAAVELRFAHGWEEVITLGDASIKPAIAGESQEE